MECRYCREYFLMLLAGSADSKIPPEVESHLEECPECLSEIGEMQKIWKLMGNLPQPQPSDSMRQDFQAMLSDFKKEVDTGRNPVMGWIDYFREFWQLHFNPRLAYSAVLLFAGLLTGYVLHQPNAAKYSYIRQIDSLSVQVSQIKQMMMFTLLENPSASQRIRAVKYSDDIKTVDQKVINALFTTLNEDPDVNVRLVTLEALVRFSDNPKVREGLVRSINLQESPLMQASIADAMVRLQEKSSVPSLQKLLEKKDLNRFARINIQKSIDKLI